MCGCGIAQVRIARAQSRARSVANLASTPSIARAETRPFICQLFTPECDARDSVTTPAFEAATTSAPTRPPRRYSPRRPDNNRGTCPSERASLRPPPPKSPPPPPPQQQFQSPLADRTTKPFLLVGCRCCRRRRRLRHNYSHCHHCRSHCRSCRHV